MEYKLEDFAEDVINKAMTGLGISPEELAGQTGLSVASIEELLNGGDDAEAIRRVAPALKLDAESLVRMARKEWSPRSHEVPGLKKFSTNFQGIMDVNTHIVWDETTREAAVFDSGADPTPMIEWVREKGLKVVFILLTHTHDDHIIDLDRLARETGCDAVFTPEQEPVEGATPFTQGKVFAVGNLKITSALTCGHSPGGTTYAVEGLEAPVAIVGDALFAGSMGGPKISYRDCLETNRQHIFTLPDNTVLCPGHGPLTSVGEEKANNPFFPEFKN